MTIEPLGSTMSLQAQSVKSAPVKSVSVEKSAAELSEASTQAAAKIDTTINVVEAAQGKETGGQSEQQASHEQIKKAVEQLNRNMAYSEAIFGIHEATNRVTIKIIDKETREVIKELPPEKTLDMIARVWEMAGILVDEKR